MKSNKLKANEAFPTITAELQKHFIIETHCKGTCESEQSFLISLGWEHCTALLKIYPTCVVLKRVGRFSGTKNILTRIKYEIASGQHCCSSHRNSHCIRRRETDTIFIIIASQLKIRIEIH